MHAQLNHIIARQRSAELRRASGHSRLATEVPARRSRSRSREAERTIGGAR
jgi:hypothetical protein